MKTWESDFRERFEVLPKNREYRTIQLLREIIREMHEEGFPGAEIGRLMGKDHTTIVHHLSVMGFKPREEIFQKKKYFYEWRKKLEKTQLENRKERDKHRKERQKVEAEKSLLYQKRRAEVTRQKIEASVLYKKGLSTYEMAEKLGVPYGRLNYLLFYGKGKNKRRRERVSVQQLDLSGNVLETFKSIRDAALKTGATDYGIRHALDDGRYKSSGGFLWRRTPKS